MWKGGICMNNEFLWEEDVDFCGIVIRFAIVKFAGIDKYGACVAQIFGEEFIMVDAAICNNFNGARDFLMENAINDNLKKLGVIYNNLNMTQSKGIEIIDTKDFI